MSSFFSFEILLLGPIFIIFITVWYTYFLIISSTKQKLISKTSLIKSNSAITLNNNILGIFRNFQVYYFIFFIYLFTFRGFEGTYFVRHLCISNFTITGYYYLILLNSFLFVWLSKLLANILKNSVTLDYIISLVQMFILLPYIIFSNSIFTLFFNLEIASSLLFYHFISSYNWFKESNCNINKKLNVNFFFNMLFFHFWSSFFSSLFIVYSGLNLYYFIGTTEWLYFNFLLGTLIESGYIYNTFFIYLILIIFFIALIVKLGISPFLIFKIEIYRGLNIIVIFFYSIIFFSIFFSIFFVIFFYYLPIILEVFKFFFLILSMLLIITVILVMFDGLILRNFFAMSSIINTSNLFILLLLY
jgi:hypothetical protein